MDPIFVYEERLCLCRAKASQSYMQELFEIRVVMRILPFYCIKALDLFDCGYRREAARAVLGVFRYLDESRQWDIPGNYGEGFF